jgi:tetratricopeptide (TPR) repeat protein
MKKNHTYLLIILCIGLSSCMKTVTMQSMRPADITVPADISSILLIDRSRPEANVVNRLTSNRSPQGGDDRAGAQAIIQSLNQQLANSSRFEVKRATETLTSDASNSAFPDPLPWSRIDQLCRNYRTQAVLAIEVFESEFNVTDEKRKVKRTINQDGERKEIEVDEFVNNATGNVKVGIRFYDSKQRLIKDEQILTRNNRWSSRGDTPEQAGNRLISRADAIRNLGNSVGSDYASRIIPTPIRITRNFYKKAKRVPELEMGGRQADVNNWKGAIETWERGIPFARIKEAGKLSYNIAVAYEVLGDFDQAKNWASRAFVDYGNKKARAYTNLIDARIAKQQRLKEQTK